MREKFYYLRKVNGNGLHRCGVVYLIQDAYDIARGTALCNETEDSFLKDKGIIIDRKLSKKLNRKILIEFEGGINKAKKRAFNALRKKCNNEKIRLKEALEKVQGLSIEYKSEFNPVLNRFEENILKDKEENFLQDGEFRSIE